MTILQFTAQLHQLSDILGLPGANLDLNAPISDYLTDKEQLAEIETWAQAKLNPSQTLNEIILISSFYDTQK